MQPEDIKQFLLEIKKKILLPKNCILEIDKYHFKVSYDVEKRMFEAIAYMDYDVKKEKILGVNPKLLVKLIMFLQKTDNFDLIQECKDNLKGL